jgi:hypothetical protein
MVVKYKQQIDHFFSSIERESSIAYSIWLRDNVTYDKQLCTAYVYKGKKFFTSNKAQMIDLYSHFEHWIENVYEKNRKRKAGVYENIKEKYESKHNKVIEEE